MDTPKRFSLRTALNFFKDTRDDDPPAMKKYCNVTNSFPIIMKEQPQDEDNWTPLRKSYSDVHYIPVRLEGFDDDSRNTRINATRHSSPSYTKKILTLQPKPTLFMNRSDENVTCTCVSKCKKHDRSVEISPRLLERLKKSCGDQSSSQYYFEKPTARIDLRDDNDSDEVEYIGTIRDESRTKKNNVQIDDYFQKYIKVSPDRNSPMLKKNFDVIEIQDEPDSDDETGGNSSRAPRSRNINRFSYIHSPSIHSRLSSAIRKPKFSINGYRKKSYEDFSHAFRMDERRKLHDLIRRTAAVGGISGVKYSNKSSNQKSSLKISDIVDLTSNIYSESKFTNGTIRKNDIRENDIKRSNTVENYERSNSESMNFTDDSSTTSLEPMKTQNQLKLLIGSNPIVSPSWLETLSKRYENISIRKESEVHRIEEESVEEALPELTNEQEALINAALRSINPNEVLIQKFNISIHRRDIHSLSGLNWLNDEVINFYMNLIMERSTNGKLPKVYGMNTFFYPKLMQSGHSGLKRWTRKVDIFSYDIILVPVHLGVHWCMSIIHLKDKTIKYYDSMGGQNKQCCDALFKYLEDEMMDKKKQKFDKDNWKLQCVKDIPQQMNGSDCGMFSCMFAEYISRNSQITFSQSDMPYFRRKMVLEIIQGQLLT